MEKLEFGTRVKVIGSGEGQYFNSETTERFRWVNVETEHGNIGWVMKTLMDKLEIIQKPRPLKATPIHWGYLNIEQLFSTYFKSLGPDSMDPYMSSEI